MILEVIFAGLKDKKGSFEIRHRQTYLEINFNLNLKLQFIILIPFINEKGKLKNVSSIDYFGSQKGTYKYIYYFEIFEVL